MQILLPSVSHLKSNKREFLVIAFERFTFYLTHVLLSYTKSMYCFNKIVSDGN